MKIKSGISDIIVAVLMFLSVVFLILAVGNPRLPGDTDAASHKVERVVAERLSMLDILSGRPELQSLPRDMVIYRYENDTLKSWFHQFSVMNDDIDSKVVYQRLVNPIMSPDTQLSGIGDSVCFRNFGPKWYLVKMDTEGNVKTLKGLLVVNSLDQRTFNGINPHFRLSDRYSIRPLSASGGTEVRVGGVPMFKVLYDSLDGTSTSDAVLLWIALAMFVLGAILFLWSKPVLKRFLEVVCGLVAAFTAMYFWGMAAGNDYRIFSPILYADGPVLYSLGAVLIINFAITILCVCVYMVRDRIPGRMKILFPVLSVGIAVLAHMFLRSIIMNSNISMELYKISGLSVYTLVVYFSLLFLLISIPMLIRAMVGTVGTAWKIGFSALAALYFVCASAVFGFRKEAGRMEVLSNRLAIDRDIALEMQLRRVENRIAEDPIIASLTLIENGATSIENRLKETYFARNSQYYHISVLTSYESISALRGGEPVAGDSRFSYLDEDSAHPYYAGIFFYNIPDVGITRMAIRIEREWDRSTRGYAHIMGFAPPGRVVVPVNYSYARYESGKLVSFKGRYSYPTTLDARARSGEYGSSTGHFFADGYTHFINRISESEAVVVSRTSISAAGYLVSFVFISILVYFLVCSVLWTRRTEVLPEKSYYRTRFRYLLMSSLWLTLVAIMLVSVIFVYRRNESNLQSMMTDRISTIQSMMENRTRNAESVDDLKSHEAQSVVGIIARSTGSDISLYGPDGRVIFSTSPMMFESQRLGCRIDYAAYRSIILEGRRYFIQKERLGAVQYFSMYAPLLNSRSEVMAVVCVPYTDDSYDFEKDAVSHSAIILTVFLLLMLIARFFSTKTVDRLFKPLSEMGSKMNAAGLETLEYIKYDRDDEVLSLVRAYNRMVSELSDSTKKLAQAERDKAWSGMARQVAHEIKNPLTPMKLQLQRIIRLKDRNAPDWQEKFDEVAGIILDHIDILTDTANEFSTFAKLYTEEPVEFNLDVVLQEEISMFDSREDVKFEYFGLAGASVSGPKPQLTRVFVNLVSNAVQAVSDVDRPQVRVSLRNSSEDGWYDIVFEDNGPGVLPENEEKLFTPNFTTKNGGSGLGLAISRSILERCEATISYSRSFSLGGACFTIKYPKNITKL